MDAILTAAAQVLEREGLARTDTNRIAEIAGVSIGSVYQYFPDKQVLFEALIERERERVRAALRGALSATAASLDDVVARAVAATFAVLGERAAIHEALFHEIPERGGHGDVGRNIRRDIANELAAFLRTRIEVTVTDVEVAAFAIVTAVNALAHEALTDPAAPPRPALVAAASTLAIRYLVSK